MATRERRYVKRVLLRTIGSAPKYYAAPVLTLHMEDGRLCFQKLLPELEGWYSQTALSFYQQLISASFSGDAQIHMIRNASSGLWLMGRVTLATRRLLYLSPWVVPIDKNIITFRGRAGYVSTSIGRMNFILQMLIRSCTTQAPNSVFCNMPAQLLR